MNQFEKNLLEEKERIEDESDLRFEFSKRIDLATDINELKSIVNELLPYIDFSTYRY